MPGPRKPFEYAIVRVVPRVDRGEAFNAGIVLMSRPHRFLGARVELDAAVLAALAPDCDPDNVRAHLDSIVRVADGDAAAGPIGRAVDGRALPLAGRAVVDDHPAVGGAHRPDRRRCGDPRAPVPDARPPLVAATPGSAPPGDVLAAFGATETPVRLAGGQGAAWRAGDIVIKPADASDDVLAWEAGMLAVIPPETVRVARPTRSATGAFVVDGWCASTFCVGRHEPRRWLDVIEAGRRLHAALRHVPRPAALEARSDRWAVADRAAWGDVSLAPYRDVPHVARLERHLAPVRDVSQVIHGDLTGNVLFADPLPPAVIDMSAYWRPASLATAIVVADALAWEGATVDDVEAVLHEEQFGQLLARALLFRIVADVEADARSIDAHLAAYRPAVDLAVRLMGER